MHLGCECAVGGQDAASQSVLGPDVRVTRTRPTAWCPDGVTEAARTQGGAAVKEMVVVVVVE